MKQLRYSTKVSFPLKHQSGIALVLSMIFMLLITLLAVTGTNIAIGELHMSGKFKDHSLAMHSAEYGLRAGEAFIQSSQSVQAINGNGLIDKNSNDPDYSLSSTWSSNSAQAPITLQNTASPPGYIIKYIGDRYQNPLAQVNIIGVGNALPGKKISNFRITAEGTGMDIQNKQYLRSYYGRQYP